MSFPSDLKYSKEHEWVRVTENTAQIGITTFAVEQLGDVTQVELPDVGDDLTKGDVFGSVESVKAVSDLYAPLTGRVTRSNTPLNDSPENVNDEPYKGAWMIEIEMNDASELDDLMDPDSYKSFVAEQ